MEQNIYIPFLPPGVPFKPLGKAVTSVTCTTYTLQINFSLNLKKRGNTVATTVRYFTLLITFFPLYSPSVYSQKAGLASMNIFASTFPVQTALSGKNKTHSHEIKNNLTDPDCGSGTSAIQIRSGTSINSGSTVLNAGNAVDNDMSTYSTHHIEGHQKDVEISQIISFTSTASATDIVKIYLSLNETLQNHTVSAQAYNWVSADGSGPGTPVGPKLNITNLNVLPASPSEISFNPGVIFNRIKIGVIANSNGNNDANLNLHHVQLTPPPPTTEEATDGGSSDFADCEGKIDLAISNTSSDISYKWYNATNVEIPNGGLPVYSPILLPGTHIFYVTATKIGCTAESPKHKITVVVSSKPPTPNILLTN